jgi:serine/threonine-protein kinase
VTREEKVQELLARYVEAQVVDGVSLDPEELCKDDPDLVDTLRARISLFKELDDKLSPPRELSPGSSVLHYRVEEKLGEGGMGQVYLAHDTKLDRKVALKALPPAMATGSERLQRFRREARLLAALNHPHIAQIYEHEESEGIQFLVLELVPGETLAERIAKRPLPVGEALELFGQIAEALEAAHAKGILHRDLKPANIKVTPEETVKVLDFGLAKTIAGDASSNEDVSKSPTVTRQGTETGVILGTAAYMSPEQARGETVDKRTDIWAFGCCLYETLTGQNAFGGKTVTDVLAAIVNQEPDWEALPRGTPLKLKDLLGRCLRKDARQRWRDIGDVRLLLLESLNTAASSQWKTREVPSARFVIRPPSTDATMSFVGNPQISPDGARLVYMLWPGKGLMLHELNGFDSRVLPGTEGATAPFFSTDGQWVGFYADEKMKKVSVAGGHPSVICDVGIDPVGAAWGPDGSIVFSPSWTVGFSQVSAAGGDPVELTTPDKDRGESGHWWPKFLPDGQRLLFTVFRGSGLNESKVAILDLQTREYHYLLDGAQAHYAPTGHLIYYRTGSYYAVPFDLSGLRVTGPETPVLTDLGSLDPRGVNDFFFSFSNDGTLVYVPGGSFISEKRLAWVSRDGRVEPLPFEPARFWGGELGPDLRRLAVTQFEAGDLEIWIYDLERETKEKLTGDGQNFWPLWHPDGRRLAFASLLTGSLDIRWSSLDGSLVEQSLVSTDEDEELLSWSPDGSSLIFMLHSGSENALWSIEVGNPEGKPSLFMRATSWRPEASSANASSKSSGSPNARPSPDGHWIAYSSGGDLYVARYPELTDRVSIASGGGPMWSRGTPELFFRSGQDLVAVRYDVVSGSFPRKKFKFSLDKISQQVLECCLIPA